MNLKTILVPVDFSDVTERVTNAAAALAKAFGGQIILLHVQEPEPDFVGFEPGPPTVRVSVAQEAHASHKQLEELKMGLAGEGVPITAVHIQGATVSRILREAEIQHADLIVMGSHGHGTLYNLLVGSVTSGVLKSAKCPLLVIPSTRPAAS
jgi:nucleotide-binding universal stress UspA family protein